MDPDWLVFDPESVATDASSCPPGAVDAHCHVFGPGDVFPFARERKYTPCDASKDHLFALRDFLGFDKNVIVQATCHGTDNRAMLDALRAARRPRSRRRHGRTGRERRRTYRDARRRRARRSLQLRTTTRRSRTRRVLPPDRRRIAPLGWHVVIYFEAAGPARSSGDFFTSLETDVVVDHMGRPDVTQSVDGPEFATLRRLMDEHENVWCKVTCPERLSVDGPPGYRDVVPFARRSSSAFPTACCGERTGRTPICTSTCPTTASSSTSYRASPDAGPAA